MAHFNGGPRTDSARIYDNDLNCEGSERQAPPRLSRRLSRNVAPIDAFLRERLVRCRSDIAHVRLSWKDHTKTDGVPSATAPEPMHGPPIHGRTHAGPVRLAFLSCARQARRKPSVCRELGTSLRSFLHLLHEFLHADAHLRSGERSSGC